MNWSLKQKLKKYFMDSFTLTTHKVAMISFFLALTTVISLLEIPGFFGFLDLDFANTVNLLALIILKLPYALLIGIIVPWLRLILPTTTDHAGGVVGELSYMLSTISLLLVYCIFHNLFNLLVDWKDQPVNWSKRLAIVELLVIIITCVLVSLINVFFNWAFILDLYGQPQFKDKLWVIFLPYNLLKFSLIFSLFLILIRPVEILRKHFNY